MIETFSDMFSLVILAGIPLLAGLYALRLLLKRKKENIMTTSEKYYREW